MEMIEYNTYSNVNNYTDNIIDLTNSVKLEDSDINVWQVVIPNCSADLIRAINEGKKNIIPLFNIESIFNERNHFTLTPFLKLETSFKVSTSFVLGMIMTVIYSYKELHLVSMNHFAFRYKKANKKGGPDFIGEDKKGNTFLLEAKATISEKRVPKPRIERAIKQLKEGERLVKGNQKNFLTNKRLKKLTIASSFRKKLQPNSRQISLSIIDPEFEEITNYYSVYDLYSRITKAGLSRMNMNLNNIVDNFCGTRFTINDTSVTIFINKKLVELSSTKDNRENFKEELFKLQNTMIKKYEQIKIKVKKDKVFVYDGIIIAY